MDNYNSTNGVSSKYHPENSKEQIHFRNRKFDTSRIMEETSPMWRENYHPYDSAPSGTFSKVVSYTQEQSGRRLLFGAYHGDQSVYSKHQRYGQMSEGERSYYRRHDKQGNTALSGAYLENTHNGHNHQSITHQESGKNYIPNTRGAIQMGSSFSGARYEEFNNYSNHQKHVSDRIPEVHYEMQRGTYFPGAYHNGLHQMHRPNRALDDGYFSFQLPGKQRGRWRDSRNHASHAPGHLTEFHPDEMTYRKDARPFLREHYKTTMRAPTCSKHATGRLIEFHPDEMTYGKDARPFRREHYKAAMRAPTCSKNATSVAVSVKSVTVVNDANLHDFLGKGNASGHSIKDEKSENDIASRDMNSSSLEGTEKSWSISEPVNAGHKEAAVHDMETVCSDIVVALLELRQIESIAPSKSIFRISRKLLVLDLNGILVDILHVPNAAQIHADREHKIVSRKAAFKRPFCEDFLNFCFNVFDIGVWSSRMKHNVEAVVDYLMGNMKKKLLFCWDNVKCTHTGFKTLEDSYKPLVLKELSKLWDKEEADLPWEKGTYSPSNTLLIDDSPYKALCNPPCTGIYPKPYDFKDEKDNSLGPGGDLRAFLEGLAEADDVQEYVKRNPIGQCSITDSSPSWNFYLQVIQRVEQRKKTNV